MTNLKKSLILHWNLLKLNFSLLRMKYRIGLILVDYDLKREQKVEKILELIKKSKIMKLLE